MKIWGAYAIVRICSDTVQASMHRLPVERLTYGWDFRMMAEGSNSNQELTAAPDLERFPLQQPARSSVLTPKKVGLAPHRDYRSSQIPFPSTVGSDIVWTSMYTTTIGIGNPPVLSRAQVDTSWGPLFVPSIYCKNERCWEHWDHMYNPLNSSTSRTNFTACKVAYPGQFYGLLTRGGETQDSVHVASIEIQNQTFESVAYWLPSPLERDDLYDTVLGLALRGIDMDGTTLHSPSLFQEMLEQGSLDDELFTLRMSRKDEEMGELTLGGIPEYVDKDQLVEIPLTQNYDGGDSQAMRFYSSNGWQVALTNLTIADGASGHSLVLFSNYTAVLSTSYPWIVFPWNETKAIWSRIGFGEDGSVPCDERSRLPNITFVFGPDAQGVTLTAWDYVLEVFNDVSRRLECQIMIGGMDREESNGFVLLGSPFLNGLYSVWDAGRKTISFANRPK